MENNSPLLLISTDWHLDKNNTELIKDLLLQKCELAVKLGVPGMFILGDIFDARKGQELVVLDSFLEILELITIEYGLYVTILPGNHDKVDYKSESSYLAHSKYVDKVAYIKDYFVYRDYGRKKGTDVYILPFFEEETWIKYYQEMLEMLPFQKGKKNVLLTHTAFSNSINNDGSKISSKISYSLLKDWDLVLSGHYHNYQQPFKNTYHLPSIRQKNFGEDGNKGFIVLNSDLSFNIEVSDFPKYITEVINLSETSFADVKAKGKELKESNTNVRMVLEGPIDLVRSFDSQELETLGVTVKKKNPEIEASIEFSENCGQIEELDEEKVLVSFEEWCKKENIDFTDGVKYLKID